MKAALAWCLLGEVTGIEVGDGNALPVVFLLLIIVGSDAALAITDGVINVVSAN